jgi:hypothetical protein
MTDTTDRYPDADQDAPIETLPGEVLSDMIRRALEALQNTRDCFDAVHTITVLAFNALEEGDTAKAKRLLGAVQVHPAAGRIPEQHGAAIVH